MTVTTQIHLLVLSISCPSEVFQTFLFAFSVHVNCHGMFGLGCAFFRHSLWGVGRQALHPTSPVASSATVACAWEGKGLHADPLPQSLREYIFDVSVFFGGRGTAFNAFFFAFPVGTSEKEGQAFFFTVPVCALFSRFSTVG